MSVAVQHVPSPISPLYSVLQPPLSGHTRWSLIYISLVSLYFVSKLEMSWDGHILVRNVKWHQAGTI